MYLSKIEIFGFKSFAQNVSLSFDSGITAIVGPNGCGKTNIVDAIRWALGEQRYSTLRSDKMEDVIFNGTKNRKPLGMAEVSIVIENTKGILPTDYSQVTVTRRVYRSGESEYLLNKTQCRLKDIIDLFMDTGMGADAYSVIELKMIETILSDKTDERRRLFEEAAGVTKYKHRRKAAYNKLENVQQDLMRVNDIIKEVQKTVNSLERQSKRAEQYNELSTNLKTLEIDLLEHEYAYLHKKLIPLNQNYKDTSIEKDKTDEILVNQESQLDQMRLEIGKLEHHLNELYRESSRFVNQIHKLEEQIIIGNQQITSLQNNIKRYEKEKLELNTQKEKLEENAVRLKGEIENYIIQVKITKQNFERLQNEFQLVETQLNSKKNELQSVNASIISLIHEIAQKNNEKRLLEEKNDNISKLIERTREYIVYYENEIKKCEEAVLELTALDRTLRREFINLELQHSEAEKQILHLRSQLEQLQFNEIRLRNEQNKILAKIDFFENILVKGEENSAVSYVLNNFKNFPTVADVISTEPQYRLAIQTALGEISRYIIVENEQQAKEAITSLNENQKGKASFIILNAIPEITKFGRVQNDSFLWADQVVRVKEPYRKLIDFLLTNVVIVEDLKEIPENLIGMRFVTTDGSLRTTNGVIQGGGNSSEGAIVVGKNEILNQLYMDKAKIVTELEELTKSQEKIQSAIESVDLKEILEKMKNNEKEMANVERRIAQFEYEKSRAQESIKQGKNEIELLEKELKEHEVELAEIIPIIKKLEQNKQELEEKASRYNSEIIELSKQRDGFTRDLNEVEITLINFESNRRNAELELGRDESTIKNIIVTYQKREEEIKLAQESIERITEELSVKQLELDELKQRLEKLERDKAEVEEHYNHKRNEIHKIELKLKDDRRAHDELFKRHHDLEMKIYEINQNLQHLRERSRTEFEIELELKNYPEDEWIDFAAKRDEVRQIKERIKMLGPINFAAFEEYKTENERLAFMILQRDDLIEAEKTLLNTIEEINNTAQKKFLDTFEKIRENFIRTFKNLFDEGDECDLRLEEGVDPLEARIEIIAKPRGKRPTSIDLLSGGEKTLTAIALLFAIYLVKPSPFCILDEVDAPLDDSNIDRFTRILKKFSDNTQFIVVTHNKRTMEAASAIYGVTMEEDGVSKIVTVRFNEEDRVKSATVATGF